MMWHWTLSNVCLSLCNVPLSVYCSYQWLVLFSPWLYTMKEGGRWLVCSLCWNHHEDDKKDCLQNWCSTWDHTYTQWGSHSSAQYSLAQRIQMMQKDNTFHSSTDSGRNPPESRNSVGIRRNPGIPSESVGIQEFRRNGQDSGRNPIHSLFTQKKNYTTEKKKLP